MFGYSTFPDVEIITKRIISWERLFRRDFLRFLVLNS